MRPGAKRIILLAMAMVLLMVASWRMYAYLNPAPLSQRRFDRQSWLGGNAIERGSMVNDLLSSGRLLGLSRPEVRQLLGDPLAIWDERWTYKVAPGTGIRADLWLYVLEVHFGADGKVTRTELRD